MCFWGHVIGQDQKSVMDSIRTNSIENISHKPKLTKPHKVF